MQGVLGYSTVSEVGDSKYKHVYNLFHVSVHFTKLRRCLHCHFSFHTQT